MKLLKNEFLIRIQTMFESLTNSKYVLTLNLRVDSFVKLSEFHILKLPSFAQQLTDTFTQFSF